MDLPSAPKKTGVRIDLPVFADAPLQYATNIAVQRGEHEFIVTFFAANPPLVLGTPEEQRAALEKLPLVPVTCLGRFVIAKGRMADFVRVMRQVAEAPEDRQENEGAGE